MNYFKPLFFAVVLTLAACQPKGTDPVKTDAAAATNVVATVNGEAITADLLDVYTKSVANKAASELTAEQRDRALDNLVRGKVIAQQAEKDGLLKDKETAGLIELSKLNVLQRSVSERYLKDKKPTDTELRAEYE